jgi:adenine-specific DNA-methyltransferase
MRYKLFGIKPEIGQWRWSEERSLKAIENYELMLSEIGKKEDDISQDDIDSWYWQYVEKNEEEIDLLRLSKHGKPEHYIASSNTKLVSSLWLDLKPNGSSQLKQIFGKKTFDTPKSVDVLKRIIKFICAEDKNSIILDSFAGSGTTAHAVLELNKEDGGNRKFILVEQEDYANTITAERVRRVIKGVKTAKSENLKKGTGGTFSYFLLGDSIEMESILTGKSLPSYEELARYIFYTATGQEFHEKKMNRKTHCIGETEQYELYMLYEPNIDWLKQNALTLDGVRSMPKYTGKQRLVFAPAKYVDDYTLLEHRIDFCQLPYEIYRIQK